VNSPISLLESLIHISLLTRLFDSSKETKFVDESLRSSFFRIFEKKEMFDIFEETIMKVVNDASVNPIAKSKRYQLVRSDVTEIIYPIGGFFKKHKDYLSLTSNSIQEYTLIVCPPFSTQQEQDLSSSSAIDDDDVVVVVGGETLIHSNGETFTSSATTKPGGALLFRKDLEHEGAVLKSGNKRIVTVNLWAID
jgi:hypothetical protein